ncbi:MAG: TrkH family potassium uptake protein [Phycisphaerae bacterium]|nr:TrkH family potassium uptake protein [Phycisphaerae bacterium]
MNFRYVGRQLGLLTAVLSVVMLVVAGWSWVQVAGGDTAETAARNALLISVGVGLLLCGLLRLTGGRFKGQLARREALLLVAASWLVGAALAALPFRLWAWFEAGSAVGDPAFGSWINCYFESISGFTTTGATVLTAIESIPRSLLLWRATTHWLGGLGIVVLFVAVLPMLGVGSKRVFRVESPGPTPEGVTPRIQETARILWLIYLGLTVAEIATLKLLGLSWFSSVCHTFATLATGGFSTLNASVGQIDSAAVDTAIIVFMLLAGVNFGLYYQLIHGRWRSVRDDPELRVYLAILAVGCLIIVISIHRLPITTTTGEQVAPSFLSALRYGLFQVVAIQTTTGFCTAEFDHWPFVAKATMVILMFVGASGGSTGGGIKVIRCLIAAKVLIAEIERMFRPNVIRPIRVGRSTVEPEQRLAAVSYLLGIVVLFAVGAVLIKALETQHPISIVTAATASAATLNNIGPGLAEVSAVDNYAWFSAPSKVVMCLLMVIGRLEVFAIIVLFHPRFWRTE